MVKLKIIVKDGALVLRISEGKERCYKSLTQVLIGKPNIERHWDESKERFSKNAVCYLENNRAISDFKEIYSSIVKEHPELSAKQVSNFYHPEKQSSIFVAPSNKTDWNFVEQYLEIVIEREKGKSGCNYEVYDKLLKKCRKIIKGFDSLTFRSIDFDMCTRIAYTFAKHDGYKGHTTMFRSLLGKASKEASIDFNLAQIGDFKFSHYSPKINEVEFKKPDVLSPEQLKEFLNLDVKTITQSYKDRRKVELYYDFCVFMFHSFFAPCDVIKTRHKDITKQKTILTKRKKTHKPVEVPVNPVMEQIINKYRGKSKEGYVFPILESGADDGKNIRDYAFKQFRHRVNEWLKHVGKLLGTDFPLYAYVFRHTAITVALDKGIPISYVSMVAGTSIDMIQKHYYNGNNQVNTDKLMQAFLTAAQ